MSDEQPAGKRKIPCIVMSRVVGYISPVRNWHDAKKLEFEQRRTYDVPAAERLEQLGAKEPQ